MTTSSSLSWGSSFTSVSGRLGETKLSSESRTVGDEASDDVELERRSGLRREKVGVTGDTGSDAVEGNGWCPVASIGLRAANSAPAFALSLFLLASTS